MNPEFRRVIEKTMGRFAESYKDAITEQQRLVTDCYAMEWLDCIYLSPE